MKEGTMDKMSEAYQRRLTNSQVRERLARFQDELDYKHEDGIASVAELKQAIARIFDPNHTAISGINGNNYYFDRCENFECEACENRPPTPFAQVIYRQVDSETEYDALVPRKPAKRVLHPTMARIVRTIKRFI